MVLTNLGWILWGLTAVVTLSMMSGPLYPGFANITRTQVRVLIVGLWVTLLFPVSKLHLLWVLPLACVALKIVLTLQAARRIDKARRAGVPYDEAMARECDGVANSILYRASQKLDESNRRIDEALRSGVPASEAIQQERARLAVGR